MKEKVILAYSGGLDTTAIIPWLKENFDYEVVCCCIDCGQGSELDGLEEQMCIRDSFTAAHGGACHSCAFRQRDLGLF